MPIGDVFIGDTRRDVEHDDSALALDVVSITETTKLLLPCGIPGIEANGPKVGRESQGVHFDTKRG